MDNDQINIQMLTEGITFESIRNVIEKAHAGNPAVDYNTADLSEKEFYGKLRKSGAVYVALDCNKLVGVMMICVEDYHNWYSVGTTAALRYIAVLPEYGKRGIATGLLNMCLEWAVKNKVNTVLWTTAYNNIAAVSLAHKNGFYNVDYLKFSVVNHCSIRMGKWIGVKNSDKVMYKVKCKIYFNLRKIYTIIRLWCKR